MSVRKCIVLGLVIGLLLGVSAYAFLCLVGNQLQEDMSEPYAINVQNLALTGGIEFNSDVCRLDSKLACEALAGKVPVVTSNELRAVTADSESLQPYYEVNYEDELNATQIIQPTDPSRPMVTLNGALIQGSEL